MKCFYHNADLDGMCSGYIVKSFEKNCLLYGIDYGDPFPWKEIIKDETVYMVDFSLPLEEMKKLNNLCNLIWIDHHKSAIEELDFDIKGIQKSGIGACSLVWKYFYPDKLEPLFVNLLAKYDVWNHTDERTLPFQYGMKDQNDTNPENVGFWESLLYPRTFISIVEKGRKILEKQKKKDSEYISKYSFTTKLEGYRCIAVNKMASSKIFDSIWDRSLYDMMLTFVWVGDKWKVSLYTNSGSNIDTSVISKKYGGGGHIGASGFICDELPFNLKENKE